MRRASELLVGHEGIPVVGPKGVCCYCHAKIGHPHGDKCVMRRRTVVVRFTVDLVVAEPESHNAELIEFVYNEGTWCADNLADLLSATVKRMDDQGRCMCEFVTASVIREASAEDEDAQRLWVNALPG